PGDVGAAVVALDHLPRGAARQGQLEGRGCGRRLRGGPRQGKHRGEEDREYRGRERRQAFGQGGGLPCTPWGEVSPGFYAERVLDVNPDMSRTRESGVGNRESCGIIGTTTPDSLGHFMSTTRVLQPKSGAPWPRPAKGL